MVSLTSLALMTHIGLLSSGLSEPINNHIFGAKTQAVGALTAYPRDNRYGAPVIFQGSDTPLVVSFDILEPERRYLRYSLVHCDATWQKDMLQPIEFTNGFNEGSIDNVAYSQGTLIPYVHYSLELPNEQVVPTVSGNYILNIYDEESPDSIMASIPFMVSEQTVRTGVAVTGRTDYDYNNAHQQLEITTDIAGLDINDPWNDVKVVITPNNRAEASRYIKRSLRVNGTTATFAHDPALTFEAGKEYRRFETVSTSRYLPMGVELVAFQDPWYHFKLYDDGPRADTDYTYDQTQFGRFTINADNVDNPDIQSEYVKVHFSLDIPEQPEASVIVMGELTGNRTDNESPGLMTYNRVSERYEKVLTLKQGSYNYLYMLVPDGKPASPAYIEGNDYRTANRYDIAIYYRAPGARYDRLIGFSTIISGT